MKSIRILVALLLLAVAATGCDGNATGPSEGIPACPVIGSGTGTC